MPYQEATLNQVSAMDRARRVPLMRTTDPGDPARDERKREADVGDEDKAEFLPVRTLRTQYIDYLTTKVDEIEEQKEGRYYYHGAQWTPAQLRILRDRRQPPQTWNDTKRKINSIVGLIERMRSDPKAAPKRPDSEAGAQIATESIRTVLSENMFKDIEYLSLLQCGIEGRAGVQMVLQEGDQGDPDVGLAWVIGDEYFYDPKSYRLDFTDNRYEGIAKWLEVDEAVDLFPDKEELLRSLVEGDSDLTTNADREFKWVITASKRLRLIEHWYKHRGRWCWAFYVSTVLIDQGASPFFDERGKSCSSFFMFGANVDHDGDRYGFVRDLKGPQDALNQGKSKTAHLANTRLLKGTKGAVDDVEVARREAARADGYLETNPGGTLEFIDTKPDLAAFNGFATDAKSWLDGYANTNLAAMTGVGGPSQLSGRAIELLRQPGMAELGPFILAQRGWKLRVYRGVWNAIQRHWTKERWLRVNKSDKLYQFIQLNGVDLDQWGRPVIVNAVGQLDVDIELDEGRDIASSMQELYDDLRAYPPGTFPPQVLIEMSPAPRSEKDRILAMLAPKPPPPGSPQEMAQRLQLEHAAGVNAKLGADIADKHASAEQRMARAAKDRAGVTTEAAKAGHLAHSAHLDASEFARDTLIEAHEMALRFAQPQQQGGAPQPRQNPQQGV